MALSIFWGLFGPARKPRGAAPAFADAAPPAPFDAAPPAPLDEPSPPPTEG